jgi:murein L,D-transpeptidase YafK
LSLTKPLAHGVIQTLHKHMAIVNDLKNQVRVDMSSFTIMEIVGKRIGKSGEVQYKAMLRGAWMTREVAEMTKMGNVCIRRYANQQRGSIPKSKIKFEQKRFHISSHRDP